MNTLKKIIITTLTLLVFFSCATSGDIKSGIKEFRMESFSVYDGSENLIQTISINYNEMFKPAEIITTDAEGNTINRKLLEYSSSGKLSYLKNTSDDTSFIQTVYNYDTNDYLIEVQTVNEKEAILGTSRYNNDERGNPIDWVSEYSMNSEKIHFIMEYDDADRLLKSSELDKHGDVIYYSASEYDDEGNEISYAIYSAEGVLDQQMVSYYSEKTLLKTEILDENGNILFRTEYRLDDNNNPQQILSFNQYDDLTVQVDISYDENGNELLRQSYDHEGKLTDKIVREYDDEGNNITIIMYNSNDEIISITRNRYVNEPLQMEDEEFNTLLFKL